MRRQEGEEGRRRGGEQSRAVVGLYKSPAPQHPSTKLWPGTGDTAAAATATARSKSSKRSRQCSAVHAWLGSGLVAPWRVHHNQVVRMAMAPCAQHLHPGHTLNICTQLAGLNQGSWQQAAEQWAGHTTLGSQLEGEGTPVGIRVRHRMSGHARSCQGMAGHIRTHQGMSGSLPWPLCPNQLPLRPHSTRRRI